MSEGRRRLTIKGATVEGDIAILNVFVTPKLIEPKAEANKCTITVGVCNAPFSVTDKESARMELA